MKIATLCPVFPGAASCFTSIFLTFGSVMLAGSLMGGEGPLPLNRTLCGKIKTHNLKGKGILKCQPLDNMKILMLPKVTGQVDRSVLEGNQSSVRIGRESEFIGDFRSPHR